MSEQIAAEAVEVAEPVVEAVEPTVEAVEVVEGEPALGDAGKKALDAMKADRNAARLQAKEFAAELAALRAQAEGRAAEHEAEQAAQKVRDDALSAANERIKKAEVRAVAAGKLADPNDALKFLDLSSLEVGDDGDIDASAVESLITDLINSKPYLAAQSSTRFQGSGDGGARNESGQPSQLTHEDVKRLSAEGKHDEIVRAKAEGRLNNILNPTSH